MTTRRRRRFTAAFKKRVVLEALRGDRTVQEIAVSRLPAVGDGGTGAAPK